MGGQPKPPWPTFLAHCTTQDMAYYNMVKAWQRKDWGYQRAGMTVLGGVLY